MELINDSGVPPKGADAVERGKRIANGMVKLLGLNLMQACAIVGYCMKESSCDPTKANEAEKSGKASGYSSALGADCGEGIFQWSFVRTKDNELRAAGLPTGGHPGNITRLSLDQQIMMVAKGSFGQAFLKYKLNTANSWDAAVCCACIQGHGSGHAKSAFDAGGGNINSEAYIRAVINSYKPFKGSSKPREDLPRAKAWAKQVYQAMGGKPGDFDGSFGGGGGSREWKDFNLKDFPIYEDENGKYTNESVGWGIANHLRIEGVGGESGGDMGGMGNLGDMSIDGGKVNVDMSKLQISNVNPSAYNLVLYRYAFGAGGKDGHRALEGVIFEYDTKQVLCYTIEDDHDVANCNLKANPQPTKMVPAANGWQRKDKWHMGHSRLTVALSGGKGPFGRNVGDNGTLLATARRPGCLFHYGKDTSWSEGCILVGSKASNGHRSFDRDAYLESNILNSSDESARYHRNFYSKIVPKMCNGQTVNMYFTGIY